MGIAFDHVQYVSDVRLMLGESTSTITLAAPFTDKEFYRSEIDPGFGGEISFIDADLYFDHYSSLTQNVTWRWQIRGKGQAAWTDLNTPKTESWASQAQSRLRVIVEASALDVNTAVPFEIRMLATAATAATVYIVIGTYTPSIRVLGTSA